jgi:hypothetical protein
MSDALLASSRPVLERHDFVFDCTAAPILVPLVQVDHLTAPRAHHSEVRRIANMTSDQFSQLIQPNLWLVFDNLRLAASATRAAGS